MIKKCIGCGIKLQTENKTEPGYVRNDKYETSDYCERCFKVIHYGEASIVDKYVDMNKVLTKISKTNRSVLYLLDLTCISKNTLKPLKKITNPLYIILTKKDLIPKSVKEKKLKEYINSLIPNAKDVIIVSSTKLWSIEELYNKLVKNKVECAYVLGSTNSGKSTLINSLLKIKGQKAMITTSPVPNTTEEMINIKLDDKLTIIDTPGFLSENNIVNFLDINTYKSLLPKKEIKPKIYHLKPNFIILIENFLRIENNTEKAVQLVFYLKNELKYFNVKKTTKDDLKILQKSNIKVNEDEDLVIEGLGFIKVPNCADLTIYTLDNRILSIRKKMI